VNATGTKLERATTVEAQTLATVRQLLVELGGSRGLEELSARGTAAHLERELGLGSLERVELMVRLGTVCSVRLPDRAVAEAETIQDLADALLREHSSENAGAAAHHAGMQGAAAAPSSISRSPAQIADLEEKIRGAESLTEIVRLRGLGEPGREHIHLYGEDEQLHTITFGELYGRASSVARELRTRGLEPGQTVAIMLPTCAEFFYTFAGILLAGGIPVPIYPPVRADRITEYATRQAGILRNAESRFLITFREAEGLARLLRPRVPTLREVLNAERLASATTQPEPVSAEWRPVENLSHHARSGDIAFLQYTSGSTGDPKGVMLTHANLLANIRSIAAGVELKPEDVAVSWLPLYHDMGLIGAWFVPLFSGVPLVVMSPLAFLSRPERWLWAIHRHRGTISPAPNFSYELCVRKIADKDLEGLDLSTWRAAFNGAEPVHADTLERFAARFAAYGFRREALLPVYGLAEATLGVSAAKPGGYKLDRVERGAFESGGRAIPAAADDAAALEFVGAGEPFPDVEVRIVADDGHDAGERCEGQLWFRSPAATSGYYRNPAATSELMREPGWLDSGDLAYRADGELYITGRAKDLIIKAGRNLYPHEIEDVAGRVAGVRTGCVVAFGAPDARSGTERLVVAAEVRSPAEANRISADITRAVHDAVGVPPDVVELVPPHSIPKTSSGKLRRGETRRLFLDGKLGRKATPPWVQIATLVLRTTVPRGWALVKRGAKGAIRFVYGIYALAVFLLVFVPLWLAVAATRDKKRVARFMHVATRTMLFAAGIPVRVVGGEQLARMDESGPWIFAPNHSSFVDILVTVAFLPANVRFVVKGEVLAMPFFGTIARRSGQFAFDRGDPQARIRQSEEVNAALGLGESVAIYPEGTFTAATGIRPFQLGAFKAAVDARRPICPVAVRGTRHILRDHTFLPRPGRVTVTFGPLLAPDPAAGDDWREIVRLRDATREIIARNSGEPLL
jgi:1-acyl-sn-glycerol-3-phosphate acyltransferase